MRKTRRISYIAYSNNFVPFIRLSGKWLENVGFQIGKNFNVTKVSNSIVLTPINRSTPFTN